jgi:hypothetical protein
MVDKWYTVNQFALALCRAAFCGGNARNQKGNEMHQRTKRLAGAVCAAVAVAALSACSDLPTGRAPSAVTASLPAGTMSTDELQALDSHGKLPALDWSDALKGVDKDGNGVRDDVDAIIRTDGSGPAWHVEFKEPAKHAAVTQLAAAYQKVATVDAGNAVAVKAVKLELTAALECAQSQFELTDETMVSSSLEVYTFNTAARQKAKEAFWTAVGNSLSVGSDVKGCRGY